jgi:hypothetical protein
MGKYAQDTIVPVERSRAEIEKILTKYGADQFASGWSTDKAVITFKINNRAVRIEMPLPRLSDPKTASYHRKAGEFYSVDAVSKESRRRWRCLVLYVKAKLESVESNIVSFEQAFMAHIVLPNRQTIGEWAAPQLTQIYSDGKMPPLLPGY